MKQTDRIYVAGHNGMVGSAIVRKLVCSGFRNIVVRTSKELDLRSQDAVNSFFQSEKLDYVFLAAAKVGGILANDTFVAEFIYDNLMIEANVINAAYLNKVQKLLFLGSSCIYPKKAEQPIKESYLLTGELESTNQPYAIAKIAGIELCNAYRKQYGCNFISAMPTNLYGPNDNYDLETSHVLPALLRKVVMAKNNNHDQVVIWGTGKPRREFLHVDDLAEASYFLMRNYDSSEIINIGTGVDISISELAEVIRTTVNYSGEFIYDDSKPDGTMRKQLDVSKIHGLGWQANISLEKGLKQVYNEVEKYL